MKIRFSIIASLLIGKLSMGIDLKHVTGSAQMNKKEKALLMGMITVIALAIIGCGSEQSNTDDTVPTTTYDTYESMPVGEWYATNGMMDYISVASNGDFTMKRVGATASGYVMSGGGDDFILVIESAIGNYPEDESYQVMDVGTWYCRVSISSSIFHVYCPGSLNNDLKKYQGNVFNPAMSYFINRY